MNRYRVILTTEVEVDADSERGAFEEAVEYVGADVVFLRSDATIQQIGADEYDLPWTDEEPIIWDSDIWR